MAQRAKALPKPPARVVVDDGVKRINDRRVSRSLLLCSISAIPGAAGEIDKPAGAGDR